MDNRCIFSKKHPVIKGYAKCQIKGNTMIDHCYKYDGSHCPHYRMSFIDKITTAILNIFER